jgi:hypothetical protein
VTSGAERVDYSGIEVAPSACPAQGASGAQGQTGPPGPRTTRLLGLLIAPRQAWHQGPSRRGGRPVAAGRYTLTLRLLSSDGQTITLRGRVTITR